MTDEPLRDDRPTFRQIVLQVGADGAVPVYVRRPWTAGAGGAVQGAAHGLFRLLREAAFQFPDQLPHDPAGRVLRLLRYNVAEGDEGGYQVHVGLYGLEHLRFEEHALEAEPFQGVLLHDAHDRRGEVRADVTEPAGDVGDGSPVPDVLAVLFATVERGQHIVHASVLPR